MDAVIGVSPAIEASDWIITNLEFPENFKEKTSATFIVIIKKLVHACVREVDWNPCDMALPIISALLIVPMTVAVLEPPVACISTV